MKKWLKRMQTVLLAVLLGLTSVSALSVAGCDDDGPMEEAGENIDEAAEETGDELEEATD